MAAVFLTDRRVRGLLESIADGTLVVVTYKDTTDLPTAAPRTIRGTLLRTAPTWTVVRSAKSRMVFPTPQTNVISINTPGATPRRASNDPSSDSGSGSTTASRDPSANRTEERRDRRADPVAAETDPVAAETTAAAAVAVAGPDLAAAAAVAPGPTSGRRSSRHHTPPSRSSQPAPRQPDPASEALSIQKMMLDFFERQQQQHQAQMDRMFNALQQRAPPPEAPPARAKPGQDFSNFMAIGEALKGNDSPSWRLATGLSLPRYIADKYKLFSIPHLLFQEDEGIMVKLPQGTALERFKSMQGNLKHQFPNQAVNRAPPTKRDSAAPAPPPPPPSDAGVRAQLERCEAMFTDLLGILDKTPEQDLPQTKDGWRLFVDAGVGVLECYSTLAYGYARGGARVALAHANSFHKGAFDPHKLWNQEGDSFRQ